MVLRLVILFRPSVISTVKIGLYLIRKTNPIFRDASEFDQLKRNSLLIVDNAYINLTTHTNILNYFVRLINIL